MVVEQDFADFDLRHLIKLNVNFIEFFGYFSPEFETPLKKILYYVYAVIFVGFIYISYMLSKLANMIAVFGDMEKMTEASFLLLTHIVHCSKLYVFATRGPEVRKLINSLNREEFKPRNHDQYKILVDDIKLSRQITKTFLWMGIATCLLWGVFPFLDKNEDKSIRLPLSGWFPFSTEKLAVFRFVYVYQVVGALVNAMANISMDTFLSGTIMVVSGQLSLLNNSFQILKQECEGDFENKLAQIQVKESLVRNVIHYRNIIQFADHMTSLFTKCIMGQFVVSVIIICLTMFQMSLVSVLSLQFLSMALYQACMVLEIFLWCYFGNEVIIKSDKLTESAYMCEWISCSEEFKKNLLFFMTRTQVPLKLYAGGYFTLSLETFKAIVKSSWSYYAVLNRVHSEENKYKI